MNRSVLSAACWQNDARRLAGETPAAGSQVRQMVGLESQPSRHRGGYGDSGFNITLSDSAPNGDIHNYRAVFTPEAGSPLTGVWQPDGRHADPSMVLDSTARTATLSSFCRLERKQRLDAVSGGHAIRWCEHAGELESASY